MVTKKLFNSREEWLQGRKNHIGGSDAAACVGLNPYKDNVQLWEEKVGLVLPEDISDKDYVQYGTEAEEYLRALFALDHPEYKVLYDSYNMFTNSSTFGENAIQIKRMANLDIGATAAEWGNYGANLGSKLDNLDLDIGKLAGSFDDLDLSGVGGNNIDKVGKVGKVGKVEDIKLSDEDLKLYRNLAERRYMNRIELKTLAPHIEVLIPESEAKNLTAQDIADKLRVLLIEQRAAGTSVSHG